jgi:hypothetical protein
MTTVMHKKTQEQLNSETTTDRTRAVSEIAVTYKIYKPRKYKYRIYIIISVDVLSCSKMLIEY